MRRKEDIPIEKVTLNLYAGDMGFLQRMYPRLGASRAIRRLVRSYREKIEAGAGTDDLAKLEAADIQLETEKV